MFPVLVVIIVCWFCLWVCCEISSWGACWGSNWMAFTLNYTIIFYIESTNSLQFAKNNTRFVKNNNDSTGEANWIWFTYVQIPRRWLRGASLPEEVVQKAQPKRKTDKQRVHIAQRAPLSVGNDWIGLDVFICFRLPSINFCMSTPCLTINQLPNRSTPINWD